MSRAAYALQRSQSVPIHRGRVRTWRLWRRWQAATTPLTGPGAHWGIRGTGWSARQAERRCRARLLLFLLEGRWQ